MAFARATVGRAEPGYGGAKIGIGDARTVQDGKNSDCVSQVQNSSNSATFDLLTKLANEQVQIDKEFLGKPRFAIDPASRTYSYDVRPVPAPLILSGDMTYAGELEILIRVASLRRDFRKNVPNQRFWLAPLDSIQQSISRRIQNSKLEHDKFRNGQRCPDDTDGLLQELGKAIATYATSHRLRLVEHPLTRDPALGYPVHIKIEPPSARVKVMTLLEYKKNQLLGVPKDQYKWGDILESDVDMIGWYHYRAEWPSNLNGPEEGDFEIKKPTTIAFRPKPR